MCLDENVCSKVFRRQCAEHMPKARMILPGADEIKIDCVLQRETVELPETKTTKVHFSSL